MKQVKSLVLAAILVCTLSAGVQAGDMGSPGLKAPEPDEPSDVVTTETVSSSDMADPLFWEIMLTLLALI